MQLADWCAIGLIVVAVVAATAGRWIIDALKKLGEDLDRLIG